MLLLFCGGVAGYVAWKNEEQPKKGPIVSADDSPEMMPGKGPAGAPAILRKIMGIELPADFEPIDGEESPQGCRVKFASKVADGAALKLAKIDASMAPPGSDSRSREPMMMRMTDMGDRRTNTAIATETESSESTRELTILGTSVTFRFVKGKSATSQRILRKVTGSFISGKGFVALIYTIPDENYDEDAVVRMIESIRAPDDESADKSNQPPNPPVENASETESERNGKIGPKTGAQSQDGKTPEPEDERVRIQLRKSARPKDGVAITPRFFRCKSRR